MLTIGHPLGTYFGEIWIRIQSFSFKKVHLKMSSAKLRPFCRGFTGLSMCLIDIMGHLYTYIINSHVILIIVITTIQCTTVAQRYAIYVSICILFLKCQEYQKLSSSPRILSDVNQVLMCLYFFVLTNPPLHFRYQPFSNWGFFVRPFDVKLL